MLRRALTLRVKIRPRGGQRPAQAYRECTCSRRRRLGAVGAAAALVLLAVAIPAGHAARTGGAPSLTAVAKSDGTVHATWTLPAGTIGEEFIYDTSDHLANIGQFANPGDVGCGLDNWCWPARGAPLYCYFVLYHDRTGDCPGHLDVADKQTSIVVGPLAKGTYYLQVTSMDQCVAESGPCPEPWEYWSNVVTVNVNPAKSGGSSGGGPPAPVRLGRQDRRQDRRHRARLVYAHGDGHPRGRHDGADEERSARPRRPSYAAMDRRRTSRSMTASSSSTASQPRLRGATPAAAWTVDSGQAYYPGTTGRTSTMCSRAVSPRPSCAATVARWSRSAAAATSSPP